MMENSKLIKIITNSGAIGIAVLAILGLLKIIGNDLSHVSGSIERQAEVQKETNTVLREQTAVLKSNTQVLEIIERRIR